MRSESSIEHHWKKNTCPVNISLWYIFHRLQDIWFRPERMAISCYIRTKKIWDLKSQIQHDDALQSMNHGADVLRIMPSYINWKNKVPRIAVCTYTPNISTYQRHVQYVYMFICWRFCKPLYWRGTEHLFKRFWHQKKWKNEQILIIQTVWRWCYKQSHWFAISD